MQRGNMPDYMEAYVPHDDTFYRVLDFLDRYGNPVFEPIEAETLLVDMGNGNTQFAPAVAGCIVTIH